MDGEILFEEWRTIVETFHPRIFTIPIVDGKGRKTFEDYNKEHFCKMRRVILTIETVMAVRHDDTRIKQRPGVSEPVATEV